MKSRSAEICEWGATPSHCKTRKKKTKKTKKKTKMSGLWSLPEDVAMNCLVQISRVDLAALSIASKEHRSLVVSPEFQQLRFQMGCLEPNIYLWLHILPEPTPRWFILNPVQRRLKPIHLMSFKAPESSSSFVLMSFGVYVIGGLVNGKPTSDVSFFHCFDHTWHSVPPMRMPRASASANIINGKIYVLGGCGDDADSSNWAEVFDLETDTWEFLSLTSPKMPLSIQHSVLMVHKNEVYGVDKDGQSFFFSPSNNNSISNGITDSKEGYRSDWCFVGGLLFCRGTRGKILWCSPYKLDWTEVKGLEELSEYDITKFCRKSEKKKNIVVFWNSRSLGSESLELQSAEISLEVRDGHELWGKIEWSGSVFKLDPLSHSYDIKVLNAVSICA